MRQTKRLWHEYCKCEIILTSLENGYPQGEIPRKIKNMQTINLISGQVFDRIQRYDFSLLETIRTYKGIFYKYLVKWTWLCYKYYEYDETLPFDETERILCRKTREEVEARYQRCRDFIESYDIMFCH